MVRSIRLLAAAALAAGLAAATPAAHAQTGPQDEGAVQTTGPLGATPQKAKPRQTALKKRARQAKQGPVRQADHGACPPVVLDPRHAGARGHGRQRLRLQHVQPADADRGHLHGHARPGEDSPTPAPGLTLFRF